ncbi:MAG: PulJ/GspJ family protein [Geminicoccaceae bacterium]
MRPRPPVPAGERGFTLLELLIAMTLLGMLMVVFSGSVQLGTRVWERSKASLDETSHGLVLANFLKDRIEQAVPVMRTTADAFEPIFDGGSDRLRMVSAMPISLGNGLYQIELEHIDDRPSPGGRGRLVLRWRQHVDDVDGDSKGFSERTLSAHVADLRLSYFGQGNDGAPPAWHPRWRRTERLPSLIRVELAFDKDLDDRVMTLTAAPVIDEWYDLAF